MVDQKLNKTRPFVSFVPRMCNVNVHEWSIDRSINQSLLMFRLRAPYCSVLQYILWRCLHHSITKTPFCHLEWRQNNIQGKGRIQSTIHLEEKSKGSKSIRGVFVQICFCVIFFDQSTQRDLAFAKSFVSGACQHQTTLHGTCKRYLNRSEGPGKSHSNRLATPKNITVLLYSMII